ncbi:hypothetical protein C2G38_1559909 [Gigaspora rosea]|uniref:Uncharacterized protein n=1 Tax=Gigaspora rosea TaxID=44941 RepID=A0A397V8Z8_9GLOM|nr:hypothetical protein C2G38_1559909 [Gigaspora rosea]CAG8543787.1 5203_t:CDS:2 [Gigaspora rosea]
MSKYFYILISIVILSFFLDISKGTRNIMVKKRNSLTPVGKSDDCGCNSQNETCCGDSCCKNHYEVCCGGGCCRACCGPNLLIMIIVANMK